ncbi:MAG TPA: GGDEF domain-containing protein [Solirubrobacteraceae bacterium]|nr:GGDEF domain-containing protein [Solirubrobacteraceae bacterium]
MRIRAKLAPDPAAGGDPYAGGDLPTARRLGALLWLTSSGLAAFLLPLSPPDEAIGGWGWLVAALLIALGLAWARVFARDDALTWDRMLASSYVGAGQVALLVWLAGGHGVPYAELYLVVALYAAALHPPRRLAGVLLAIAVCSAAPLVYDVVSAEAFSAVLVRLVLLSALALLAASLMRSVRAQRIEQRSREEEAERLARHDELTGLPNRRAFTEILAAEVSRVRRSGAPLSVVVADLDAFKRINDTWGHPAGDACLASIATVLRDGLRQYDSCFRWGGDEFTLVLPETSLADAEIVCDRLAAAVRAACAAPDGAPLRITCAPAELDDGMTGADLVLAADEALLARKRRGGLRLASTA